MVIANNFQNQPKTIANYSYTQLTTGQGVQRLYLLNDSEDTSNYVLTGAVIPSDDQFTSAFNQTVIRYFRSLPVTFPQLLSGTALFSTAWFNQNAQAGSITAELFIYDGSTSTSITDAVTFNRASVAGTFQQNVTLQLPLDSDTLIKPGEQYELKVSLYGAGGGSNVFFSHDPIGRQDVFTSSETVSTVAFIDIPFRIDL